MINKLKVSSLKEVLLLSFTISLVISYFASAGYYGYFSIDIGSYLSIEDLILVFAKWVWITSIFSFILIWKVYRRMEKPHNENKWDKTIGRTNIKRRALIVIPIIGVSIILAFVFPIVRRVFMGFAGIATALMLLAIIVAMIKSSLQDGSNESLIDKWISVATSSLMIVMVFPTIGGGIMAEKFPRDSARVIFQNGDSLLTHSFVGKTHNYFFVYDSTTKTATSYNMGYVKSLEIFPAKISINE